MTGQRIVTAPAAQGVDTTLPGQRVVAVITGQAVGATAADNTLDTDQRVIARLSATGQAGGQIDRCIGRCPRKVIDVGAATAIVGVIAIVDRRDKGVIAKTTSCLLYTSPSPRDATLSRMPSSA